MELLLPNSFLRNKALPTSHLVSTQGCPLKQGRTHVYENISQRVRERKIWFPLFASGLFCTDTQQLKTMPNWDGTVWLPESHVVLQGSTAETTFLPLGRNESDFCHLLFGGHYMEVNLFICYEGRQQERCHR